MSLYFRQFWQDPRLSFERRPGLEKIVLSPGDCPFWTPDTFFVNEKEAHVHTLMGTNSFVRILHTGEVLLSKR